MNFIEQLDLWFQTFNQEMATIYTEFGGNFSEKEEVVVMTKAILNLFGRIINSVKMIIDKMSEHNAIESVVLYTDLYTNNTSTEFTFENIDLFFNVADKITHDYIKVEGRNVYLDVFNNQNIVLRDDHKEFGIVLYNLLYPEIEYTRNSYFFEVRFKSNDTKVGIIYGLKVFLKEGLAEEVEF